MSVAKSFLVFAILTASAAHSENLSGSKHFSELLFESTYVVGGTHGGFGTAFCVLCSNAHRTYLLTARHVLDSLNGDTLIIYFRKKSLDGSFQILPTRQAIRANGKALYATHPNMAVDLAALAVILPKDSVFLSQFDPLPRELIATDEDIRKYWIHPGDEVFFLGYPLGEASPTGLFPILRTGFVASYPILPLARTPVIYLDGRVFEGNSGGPVYFEYTASSWNERYLNQNGKILGVVSGYQWSEAVRKIDVDTTKRKHDLQLGAFVNSGLISELLDSLCGN
jgi:hypothetical protein